MASAVLASLSPDVVTALRCRRSRIKVFRISPRPRPRPHPSHIFIKRQLCYSRPGSCGGGGGGVGGNAAVSAGGGGGGVCGGGSKLCCAHLITNK